MADRTRDNRANNQESYWDQGYDQNSYQGSYGSSQGAGREAAREQYQGQAGYQGQRVRGQAPGYGYLGQDQGQGVYRGQGQARQNQGAGTNPYGGQRGQGGGYDQYGQAQQGAVRTRPQRASQAPQRQRQVGGVGSSVPRVGATGARGYNTYQPHGSHGVAGDNRIAGGNSIYADYNDRRHATTRRGFIAAGCLLGLSAVIGGTGYYFWSTRTVECQIDGVGRKVKINSSPQYLIDQGIVNPLSGNLVSIPDNEGNVEILGPQQGNSYTLDVNGEPVDVNTYRLQEGDVLDFHNGTDITEPAESVDTPIGCGVQIPEDGLFLAPIGIVSAYGCDGKTTVSRGTMSGRTIDYGVTQEPQDFTVAIRNVNPDDGRHLVALTFDDGPDPTYTPQYLDILAQYGARATFFNLSQNAEAYPDLCIRLINEGHQLASHTYDHTNLLELSYVDMRNNVISSLDTFERITGTRPTMIRPPYGNLYGKGFAFIADQVTCSAYWSVDSMDWSYAQTHGLEEGAAAIVDTCTQGLNAENYNGAIILMHDGGGDRSRDVLALPTLIQTFQSFGYELVTMNELLKADSTIPSWVSDGNANVPEGCYIPDLGPYL